MGRHNEAASGLGEGHKGELDLLHKSSPVSIKLKFGEVLNTDHSLGKNWGGGARFRGSMVLRN